MGLRLNEHMEHPEGGVVFQHACKMGLEGIVSKRLGSRYRSGRSPDWLKFKNPDAPAVKREAEEDWGQIESGIQSALRSPAFQLMVPKAERRASSAGTFFSSATFIASRTMPLNSSS